MVAEWSALHIGKHGAPSSILDRVKFILEELESRTDWSNWLSVWIKVFFN